jgi:hypothetical protein
MLMEQPKLRTLPPNGYSVGFRNIDFAVLQLLTRSVVKVLPKCHFDNAIFLEHEINNHFCTSMEPGQRSRYSDWLRAGLPMCWSSSPGRVKNFLFSTSSKPALGSTQPPIQWVPGSLSPEVKQPGRESDHSPAASAEIKNLWIYTFTPPYAFMA